MKNPILLLASACALSACATQPAISVAGCTDYCSSYEEGYQWAQNNAIPQESFCDGYTADFTRGCQQQIEDKQKSFAPRPGF